MAATPPDRHEPWQVGARPAPLRLRTECWDGLVLAQAPARGPTFSPAVIHAPRCDESLLLNTALPLTGAQLQAFSLERWPVEGLP